MKLSAAAAIAAFFVPGLALAAPLTSALARDTAPPPAAPEAAAAPGPVRMAMSRQTLSPGGRLEHRNMGERYLFVVSGRLKVSDLVTGEEQVVEAGKMAAEQPGELDVAEALGSEPVVLYVVDRSATAAATTHAGGGGN